MKTIRKYQLSVIGRQVVPMPAGSVILSAAVQRETICLWAMVDPNTPPVGRVIVIVGTGHEVPAGVAASDFLGTVQLSGGLVFHVFECREAR